MQQAAGAETLAQAADRGRRRSGSLAPPTAPVFHSGASRIVDGDEGRLAAHRQPHVLRDQIAVDRLAERVETRPGFVGERRGDPRRLAQALHAHLEAEIDLAAGSTAPEIGAAER